MVRIFLPLSLLPLRVTAVLTLVAGLVYFLRRKPMPYHQRYLVVPFASLEERTRGLILALLHATGCGLLSVGLGLGILAWGPLPAHAAWAGGLTWAMLACSTVSMTLVTLKVGFYTPWWLILILGLSSMAGLCAYS
jgi:hypothetical protein